MSIGWHQGFCDDDDGGSVVFVAGRRDGEEGFKVRRLLRRRHHSWNPVRPGEEALVPLLRRWELPLDRRRGRRKFDGRRWSKVSVGGRQCTHTATMTKHAPKNEKTAIAVTIAFRGEFVGSSGFAENICGNRNDIEGG